ncbi:type IV pilus secretin PilQ [Sandaracinus amylolyticus]|uniref:type IV pilus secretin PilQ n=1 Tax=Sandaracinus amylolyticus TaxID=927083 RepID=UPI001F02C6F7|nr:type IV pilus secretin PilQ [Sandaracinus amylolyticus]UJR79049.1 Type IV pilus biogenesis and competence protein PilQ [Sandaracinus amylolyticus]
MRRLFSIVAIVALLWQGTSAVRAQPASSARVEALALRGDETRADVVIRGAFDVPVYAVRSREGGRVVVVDVQGASLGDAGAALEGDASLITRTTSSTSAHGVRIELETRSAVSYRVRASSGRIQLRLEALPEASEESESAVPVVSGAAEPERERVVDADAPLAVRGVTVERRDGRDRVVVSLSRGAEFRLLPGRVGPARLELPAAEIAPGARREVRVEGDDGVVRSVRVRGSDGRTIVEVDRAEGATGTAIREGDRIVWLFAAPPPSVDDRPRSRTISRETHLDEELGTLDDAGASEIESEEAAAFLTDVPLQVDAARGSRQYRGRRIDLDFNNADIHNILRLLAEVGGVNIVTSDDVTGTVTIRMRNVPWDQALEVVLQAKGLGMVRRGNLIRVAPLSTLEKEREAAIARRKQQVELAPLETRLVPVSYATASELEPRVRELLSPRGTVSVDERTNVLIVRDMVEALDDVEELVRTLDTQTPQVLVEARIVEATSQYIRDVGIQWGGDVTMSTATGNPTGLVFPSSVGVAGGAYDQQTPTAGLSPFSRQVAVPNFGVNLPATVGTGAGGALGLTLGSLGGNVHLAVRLSAAEASGTVRIISSPRILTLDNHEAHIAQGTLIPYSQISAQGVQTAFQEAKLELRVRPHVTSDGSVAMHVRITRDEPDFTRTSVRGDPTILKREAETDLLVDDGHTAVIGGIYTRTTGRNVDQVPFFGDIPILGVLFQRRRVRDERSELLIFLTPRIVNRDEALRR